MFIGIFEAPKMYDCATFCGFKFNIVFYLESSGRMAYIETHPNNIEVVRCMVTSGMHIILGLLCWMNERFIRMQ